MKKLAIRILWALIILFSPHLYIEAQVSLKTIDLGDNIPSTSVKRVFQDADGLMWFGTTDGLCRFDGYNTLVFRSDYKNSALPHNDITYLAEDKHNRLWIGTRQGIALLDRGTYTFTLLDHESVRGKMIQCIKVTSDSLIWVGAGAELYCFNPDLSFRKEYREKEYVVRVTDIYEDSYGDVWFCRGGTGIMKYDKAGDSLVTFPAVGRWNDPYRIFQDSNKQYWVCTWGDGIFLFDPNKNRESMYTPIPVPKKGTQEQETIFFSIVQDDVNGDIWTVSYSGVIVFRQKENNQIEIINSPDVLESTNNIFSEIFKDRDGNLWIGAFFEGALLLNFDQAVIENYDLTSIKTRLGFNPNIQTVYEDQEGLIWFNQNRYGLGVYYPASGEIKDRNVLFDKNTETDIRISDYITCLVELPESNKMWIGSGYDDWIYELEKQHDEVVINKIIMLHNYLPNNSDSISINYKNIRMIVNDYTPENPGQLSCFFKDNKNNIWIGTTNGLMMKPYDSDIIQLINYHTGHVTAITEDTHGAIWIATGFDGLIRITTSYDTDWDKLQIDHFRKSIGDLPGDNIQTVSADKEGRIWIGTIDGNVLAYDNLQKKFHDYTHRCGMKGHAIQDIVADNLNHIWITTSLQLTEYNPENDACWAYSHRDGIQINSFIKNAVYKSRLSNRIFFGGNMGITALSASSKLSGSSNKTNAVVTDVKIQNRSLLQSQTNDQFKILNKTLVLRPTDSNIEFDFSSLNYGYPEKVQYAYMLSGIDQGWIQANADRQFATYNQLKRGSYTFKLKATDESKIWNDDVFILSIYKQPAYYETWLAYILYSCTVIGSLFFLMRFIANRIQLKNQLRISEIEREKAEELAQTKLRYFTNISHDFLTPLTIISCTIDDVETTLNKKFPQFDTMRSSVNRLRRLLQQILDFRKIENNSIYLRVSYGDIVLFVKDICFAHFAPLIKKNNINFTFSANPLNILTYFDADKVEKIIFNIMSNAFKYTPEGGNISLTMNTTIRDGHEYLSITISDSGMGIEETDLKNIFTRFYFNKNNKTNETNGIGLSVTKDLVELHHGKISVVSKINEGTSFTIEIPVEESFYSKTERLNSLTNITSESSISSRKTDTEPEQDTEQITLLLVEDNEELQITIRNILSKNYNVLTAGNGIEALQKLEDSKIDIVVSDVMMPGMDGLELCRIMKSNIESSHIPMLMLTAKNSVEDRIDCYNAGADGYISKPFDLKVLEARINNFLANKKKNQKAFQEDLSINISKLEYTSQDEQFLASTVKTVEEHLTETEFDNIAFAQSMNMSRSSLYRKIKTMTGLSPVEFIRNIRLKHACTLLKNQTVSISEVAYTVGFTDPKYFSQCFKQEFGITPKEYQKNENSDGNK